MQSETGTLPVLYIASFLKLIMPKRLLVGKNAMHTIYHLYGQHVTFYIDFHSFISWGNLHFRAVLIHYFPLAILSAYYRDTCDNIGYYTYSRTVQQKPYMLPRQWRYVGNQYIKMVAQGITSLQHFCHTLFRSEIITPGSFGGGGWGGGGGGEEVGG